jgi:acyl-CoA reductase-like NAD-dependent aldehyde dehydrogenase
LGAISRKEQLAYLSDQVSDAVSKGATLLAGGKSIEGKGYYFEPSVLVNVNHEDEADD